MVQRRLESGFGATRTLKYELALADNAGGACNGGSVVRSIGMEQHHVHRQRSTRTWPQLATGPADWLWSSRRALFARQSCLRRHTAIERLSRFAKAPQHGGDGNNESSSRSARYGHNGN